MNLTTTALLDLSHTLAGDYLAQFQYPWEALDGIQNLILTLGPALDPAEYEERSPGVWVHKTAALAPTAFLGAPCIIGPETEVTSNVKSDKTLVTVRSGAERLETGRKKFGAILGDHVEVGCNSVLNPGSVLGRNTSVYPLSSVRGAVPPDSIFKGPGQVVHRD